MDIISNPLPKTISDFKAYFDGIKIYLKEVFKDDSMEVPLSVETFCIGLVFGSLNSELSDKTANFINSIVPLVSSQNQTHDSDKLAMEQHEKEIANFIRNQVPDMDVFKEGIERIKSGNILILKALERSWPDFSLRPLKAFFYRFANEVISLDGDLVEAETNALNSFHNQLFKGINIDLSYTVSSNGGENSEDLNLTLKNSSEKNKRESNEEGIIKGDSGESIDELLFKLNSLIGLDSVKQNINELINFLKVQQIRQSKGLKTESISRHLVFYGNPGTGKTTVARLISRIFKTLGILSKGHLIEIDRSGLVAGYVGQTAIKVNEVVNRAIGGVLFIDEAYTSSSKSENDYGKEVIESLLKLMEDNRDDLVVIVAGYTEKMDNFLSVNPGFRSRFNKFINFPDYMPNEMTQIFESFTKVNGYLITQNTRNKLMELFDVLYSDRNDSFGNGRLVRNIFELTINNQANRIISISELSDDILTTIEEVDLPKISELQSI